MDVPAALTRPALSFQFFESYCLYSTGRLEYKLEILCRAISSVGRASRLHREGRRFEPVIAHHPVRQLPADTTINLGLGLQSGIDDRCQSTSFFCNLRSDCRKWIIRRDAGEEWWAGRKSGSHNLASWMSRLV